MLSHKVKKLIDAIIILAGLYAGAEGCYQYIVKKYHINESDFNTLTLILAAYFVPYCFFVALWSSFVAKSKEEWRNGWLIAAEVALAVPTVWILWNYKIFWGALIGLAYPWWITVRTYLEMRKELKRIKKHACSGKAAENEEQVQTKDEPDGVLANSAGNFTEFGEM